VQENTDNWTIQSNAGKYGQLQVKTDRWTIRLQDNTANCRTTQSYTKRALLLDYSEFSDNCRSIQTNGQYSQLQTYTSALRFVTSAGRYSGLQEEEEGERMLE